MIKKGHTLFSATLTFIIVVLCISSPTASAQGKAPLEDLTHMESLPPVKEGDILCKAVCTFSPKKGEIFYVKVDSDYYAAPLNGEGVSQSIQVRGSRKFTLFKKSLNEDEEEIYKPVLNATLGGNGTNYLIILSRQKNKKIQSIVHNLSTSNLAANNIHIFNYSPVDLGIKLEEKKYLLTKNKQLKHGFKIAGRNQYTSAKVYVNFKDEAKIMGSKRLRLIPGRRIIFVCFKSEKRVKQGSTPLGMIAIQDIPK